MKYMIDTANQAHIDEVLDYGVRAVTANPSMYQKSNVTLTQYLDNNYEKDIDFLSFEPKDQEYEEMIKQIDELLEKYERATPKINFSKKGLKLVNHYANQGIETAMSLIFSVEQAIAALNAGANYLFVFIGRNEAIGLDGLQIIKDIKTVIDEDDFDCDVVAASLKKMEHLTECAKHGIQYAAIPYNLYIETLHNDLAVKGEKEFLASNDYLI